MIENCGRCVYAREDLAGRCYCTKLVIDKHINIDYYGRYKRVNHSRTDKDCPLPTYND
jgi:hypothetical protein